MSRFDPSVLPPIDEKEVLRYAGCKQADGAVLRLLDECSQEAETALQPNACYLTLPLEIMGDTCNFGLFNLTSRDLAKTLSGCEKAVVFAATLGVALDRLILKHGRLSPARAVMLQAIGAERIEAYCDLLALHASSEEGLFATRRFSPGYGDLPLSAQKTLFAVLQCEKRLGLCLNDSLLMTPTKSVTAIFGLKKDPDCNDSKCSHCTKKDCSFRGV